MSNQDKHKILLEKADALVKWFDGKELPKARFKIAPGVYVEDCRKYFQYCLDAMVAYRKNPYSKAFVMCYYRLDKLKNYMDHGVKQDI